MGDRTGDRTKRYTRGQEGRDSLTFGGSSICSSADDDAEGGEWYITTALMADPSCSQVRKRFKERACRYSNLELGHKLEVKLITRKGAIEGLELCCQSAVVSMKYQVLVTESLILTRRALVTRSFYTHMSCCIGLDYLTIGASAVGRACRDVCLPSALCISCCAIMVYTRAGNST